MVLKKIFLFFIIICFSVKEVQAQEKDFCNAIQAIIGDGPNKFRNIRGNLINAGSSATIWACTIKVPGTINSRFVASKGLFYEGAFFQSKNKDEVKGVYDKYKDLLSKCFLPQGYTISLSENFYPGLSDYKKIAFMPAIKEDGKADSPPPHVTMEATYSKSVGYYTIVMYIFEH